MIYPRTFPEFIQMMPWRTLNWCIFLVVFYIHRGGWESSVIDPTRWITAPLKWLECIFLLPYFLLAIKGTVGSCAHNRAACVLYQLFFVAFAVAIFWDMGGDAIGYLIGSIGYIAMLYILMPIMWFQSKFRIASEVFFFSLGNLFKATNKSDGGL